MPDIKNYLKRLFTPRRVAIASISLCVVIAFMILFDQALMPWYTKHGEALAVPNIVAKRYEIAKEILEAQGLVAVKGGEKHDADLPFGYIVEQNPRANRLVKQGRRVYLTISVGEPELEVPGLVGLSEKNALERIKSHGLRIGEILYEFMPNELADVVVSQSEAVGNRVKASTSLDITVSLGRPTENVTVPSVLAKTLDVARREIAKAGLTVGAIKFQVSEQFLPNTVIDQSIEGGASTKLGTSLDLTVTTVDPQP